MNNPDEKPIPSPFLNELRKPSEKDKEFANDITDVCANYGYKNFFIAFTEGNPGSRHWKSMSNGIGENMVQCLEIIIQGMRATWDQIKNKKK